MQRLIIGTIIVMLLVSNSYAVEKWPARHKSITLENVGDEPEELADDWKATIDECYYIAFFQNGKVKGWKDNPGNPVPIPSGTLVKVFSMQPMLVYRLPFDWMEHYPNLEDCEEAYWGLLRNNSGSGVEPRVSPFWIYCEVDGDGNFSFITQMGREFAGWPPSSSTKYDLLFNFDPDITDGKSTFIVGFPSPMAVSEEHGLAYGKKYIMKLDYDTPIWGGGDGLYQNSTLYYNQFPDYILWWWGGIPNYPTEALIEYNYLQWTNFNPGVWDPNGSGASMAMTSYIENGIKTKEIELKPYYDNTKSRILSSSVTSVHPLLSLATEQIGSYIPDSGDRPDCNVAEYAELLPDITEPNFVTVTTSGGDIQLQYQFCMQTYKMHDSNDPNSYEWTFLGPVEPVVMPYGEYEMWENMARKGCYRIQMKVPMDGNDVRKGIDIQQDPNTALIYQVYKKTGGYAYLVSNPVLIDEHDNWAGSWILEDQIYSIFECPSESFNIEFESSDWDIFFDPLDPDLNGDGFVDFVDWAMFSSAYLADDGGDFDESGNTDIEDMTIFVDEWLLDKKHPFDFIRDRQINFLDYSFLANCWNEPCADLTYDELTDYEDLVIIADNWLTTF